VRVSGDPTALLPWHGALRQVEAALSELSAHTELSTHTEPSAHTEMFERQD
jgi:hypothetical protein